ncbi:MAG: UbiH/UbiF family hydroxylase [Pseudomonadota bacterium]
MPNTPTHPHPADSSTRFDIAVVGGGLVGLVTTLALASAARETGRQTAIALIAPAPHQTDMRTTAMLMPTIEALKNLNLWDALEVKTAALKTMRLIDGSKRLIRAPVVDFKSTEVGLDAFGYNVPNADFNAMMRERLANEPSVTVFDTKVVDVEIAPTGVDLALASAKTVSTALAVAADGRTSALRQAAGIETRKWSYPQTAIVLAFKHQFDHGGVSAEYHTETGPFTQVPLPPTDDALYRSSLVWMVKPQTADELIALGDAALAMRIEQGMQSWLGKISLETMPHGIPMEGLTALGFGANGVALVGETAHVFPPIGAQGFNLGMRDALDLVATWKEFPSDQTPAMLARYSRKRLADVTLRTTGVDLLNRSLLTDFLPVQAAKATGVTLLKQIGWLRRFAMRTGLGARTG